MTGLFDLLRPGLQWLDAEDAHRLTVKALTLSPFRQSCVDEPALAVDAFGLRFSNPVGLAAGFDKHAEVPDALMALGFGFVEVGGVTPRPQPGNPRPRVFRLAADEAVINRYGFNSEGLEAMAARLSARKRQGILGVNLGSNKDTEDRAADYCLLVGRLARDCEFLTLNISSPNTPGLRAMQSRALFDDLVARVRDARDSACDGHRRTPLLVKIAPDVSEQELDDIVAVARDRSIDGMIVSNTTLSRPETLIDKARADEAGGLSGRPLFRLSTIMLAKTAQRCEGAFPLIGVGGIDSGPAAEMKLRAGASLVQLYSALVYKGPGLVGAIKAHLAAAVRKQGGQAIAALTGTAIDDCAEGRF